MWFIIVGDIPVCSYYLIWMSIPNPQVESQELISLFERLSLTTNGYSNGSSKMEAQDTYNKN